MKVVLVHDYIKEYGGAERVLKVLADMYPDAPIYTAFCVRGSTAEKELRGRDVRESWLAPLLKIGKLYSPLRFLTPFIWRSINLSEYNLVITSCSWYITRGFKVGPKTKVIAYCHTPPRWLYGYETSVGFTKYWPVKIYSAIVGHFMRMYDFTSAAPIEHWIANSKNVQARIQKFYRKESTVIYPPVNVNNIILKTKNFNKASGLKSLRPGGKNYFLIVSRLVGAKGLEEAVGAFGRQSKYKLKIVGEAHGFSDIENRIKNMEYRNVELVGRVNDRDLYQLYAGAIGFIALARDEDFGMTPVEAMAAGCPVIAFNGGGFKESVIDPSASSGQVATGILINDTNEETIKEAVDKLVHTVWDRKRIQNYAKKFSKERFEKEVKRYVSSIID